MLTSENKTVEDKLPSNIIFDLLKIEINGRLCLVKLMLSVYDVWGKRNSLLPFDDEDNFKKNLPCSNQKNNN
jgi:hypothetical protein